MKKLAAYLLVTGAFLASCKKEVPYAQEGITAVSIEFNFPAQNEQITVGEETHVEGIIDADEMMGGWDVLVKKVGEGDTILQHGEYCEQTQYVFHHHWYPQMNAVGQLEVEVRALTKDGAILDRASRIVSCN